MAPKHAKSRLAELDYRYHHRVNEWKPKEPRVISDGVWVPVVPKGSKNPNRLTKAPRRKS